MHLQSACDEKQRKTVAEGRSGESDKKRTEHPFSVDECCCVVLPTTALRLCCKRFRAKGSLVPFLALFAVIHVTE